MAYDNKDKDTRPKSPFDLYALTLWTPNPETQGKNASFSIDVDLKGMVSFRVRTGNPADKEKGTPNNPGDVIQMRLPIAEFEQFQLMFGDMLRNKGEIKYALTEQNWFRFNKETKQRERMDKPKDATELFFGKDSEGIVYVSMVSWNKPKFTFNFVNDRPQFLFKHGNGAYFTPGENSTIQARGYHKLLSELHMRVSDALQRMHVVPDLYQPPYVPKPPQGGYNKGGNGGGGGGGSYGGGGQSSAPKPQPVFDDDDDVPY